MKITVGTYNVRGICARTARTKLKNVIWNFNPAVDILAIQEHKLRKQNINFLTSTLWPQAEIFNLPAIDGIHAQRNPTVTGGKGGEVIIAVNPAISPLIVNNGRLPLNGGLWIHLDTADDLKIGFAAVYAPHSTSERAQLWTEVENSLDRNRKWIFAGDYNMITNLSDQTGGTPRTISDDEENSLRSLVQTLDLQDSYWRADGVVQFSWDNRRLATFSPHQDLTGSNLTDGGRILKRLNRIYADSSILRNAQSSEILIGSELSDHLPVLASFQLGQPKKFTRSNYRMNVSELKDKKLLDNLTTLWTEWETKSEVAGATPLQTLRSCIKRSAKYCQIWGKKNAAQRKLKQERLASKVLGLTLQLQADPSNIYSWQLKLEAVQSELNLWETEKALWMQQHLDRTPRTLQQTEDTEEMLTMIDARVTTSKRDSLRKHCISEELGAAAKMLGKCKCPVSCRGSARR
ncbi:hypothetical protein R1sor_018327 [Riccia sorocarpa]|uniref:Endonuclease/exonuclease/phosphatase domain-containing protein n=1 Tax=Riccia sorocarpa TaxID=122646 RepID=A0ABD3I9D9_9MARC